MHNDMKPLIGKALTVTGPVEPEALGKVMMHEHLHSDSFDYDRNELVTEEKPDEARRQVLLNEAVPWLKRCTGHGCFAFVDTTMPPWRASHASCMNLPRASSTLRVSSNDRTPAA